MTPPTFRFSATVPALAGFTEPLRELIRQGLAYAGYPAVEASTMAGDIEEAAFQSLPDAEPGEVIGLHFSIADHTLVVEVDGNHLSSTPPRAGLMDTVTVAARDGRPAYRFARRLPAA
jgi:hypothetical protein